MPVRAELDELAAVNRRELMKRSLRVGGIAYVAPMILAAATPASAQISQACVGATCQTFIPCQNNPNCVCFSLANGSGWCGIGVSCAGLTPCSLQTPCPTGFVCQVNTCCGAAGICVNVNTACNIAGGPGAHGPGTSAGLN